MPCLVGLRIEESRERPLRDQPDLQALVVQVSADGPQTRDISLPWDNSQIDAARRTFLDRHPLAKNKEQVALAKGEGVLLSAAS